MHRERPGPPCGSSIRVCRPGADGERSCGAGWIPPGAAPVALLPAAAAHLVDGEAGGLSGGRPACQHAVGQYRGSSQTQTRPLSCPSASRTPFAAKCQVLRDVRV